MRARKVLVGAAAVIASAVALVACRGMSKAEVETTLLSLAKNERLRELGLATKTMRFPIEGTEREVEIAYVHVPRRGGDAAARPVVLVHGTPGSLFTWADVVAAGLAQERDVYLLDVIGHGVTRAEEDDVTFQKCADWVARAVRELGIAPAHLVGQSYGGEFCWRAALDHPDLFRTLTLMDSAGYERPPDGWLPEEVKMREMSLAPIGWVFLTREKLREAVDVHFPAPVSDERIEEYYAVSANAANWRAMVDLARDENGTRERDIAKITQPTLLVWGANDIAYPVDRVAKRFAKDINGSQLRVLDGAGHYVHETLPDKVAAELNAFFRNHP